MRWWWISIPGRAADGSGVFSASQVARQLGIPLHTTEVARTFAEIEAVISQPEV